MKKPNKGIKHSIADKIVFSLLCAGSVVMFLCDIFKDFIPEQYWELKLLVLLIGALSAFFTFLSFYWDKKFAYVSKEFGTKVDALDTRIETQVEALDTRIADESNNFVTRLDRSCIQLEERIQVFMDEEFYYADTFDAAMGKIKSKNMDFKNVKIFAYSAINYLRHIHTTNITIENLQLCLRRANDYAAWFVRSASDAQRYQDELADSLRILETLKEENRIKDYCVKFYDFEAYTHFGIFDDQIMFGDLIPIITEDKTVEISPIIVASNVGRNRELFENKDAFFNKLFACCGSDSGVKRRVKYCPSCLDLDSILDQHHRNGTTVENDQCDISLLTDTNCVDNFVLMPDIHPISQLHMLLMCKYHILNIFDCLLHQGVLEELNGLVSVIRDVVRENTGRDIIIFEHGSATEDSELTASSVKHQHLHIIFKPNNDFYRFISEAGITRKIQDGQLVYKSLKEFSNDSRLSNKDYFMIWDPSNQNSDDNDTSCISVWLPKNQESQFLRRIFFQCLSDEEKIALYGKEVCDDSYNWKIHEYKYSKTNLLNFHMELGKKIEIAYKQWKESKN